MNNQNTRNKDPLEVAKKQMIKEQKEIFNKEKEKIVEGEAPCSRTATPFKSLSFLA